MVENGDGCARCTGRGNGREGINRLAEPETECFACIKRFSAADGKDHVSGADGRSSGQHGNVFFGCLPAVPDTVCDLKDRAYGFLNLRDNGCHGPPAADDDRARSAFPADLGYLVQSMDSDRPRGQADGIIRHGCHFLATFLNRTALWMQKGPVLEKDRA